MLTSCMWATCVHRCHMYAQVMMARSGLRVIHLRQLCAGHGWTQSPCALPGTQAASASWQQPASSCPASQRTRCASGDVAGAHAAAQMCTAYESVVRPRAAAQLHRAQLQAAWTGSGHAAYSPWLYAAGLTEGQVGGCILQCPEAVSCTTCTPCAGDTWSAVYMLSAAQLTPSSMPAVHCHPAGNAGQAHSVCSYRQTCRPRTGWACCKRWACQPRGPMRPPSWRQPCRW